MIGAQAGGRTANAWSARPLPGGVGPVKENHHLSRYQRQIPVTGIARREVGKVGSTSGGTIGNLRLTW